jgi:pilus assembly protein CpaB
VSRAKRSVIAILIAVVMATVGSGAVLLYVKSADTRAVQGKQAVTVLITTKRIPAGTTGREIRTGNYVEPVVMPAAAVPNDALERIDPSLDNLTLTADLQPRQLLLRGSFGAGSNLAGGLLVPDGKLAVTVATRVDSGVPFVRPGSKVAVFNTYTLRDGPGRAPSGDQGPKFEFPRNHATRLLLPRVEVLAVGLPDDPGAQTAGGGQQESAGAQPKIEVEPSVLPVTFAVTQDEAERLIHAAQTGLLYVALLNDSSDVRPGPGVDNGTLFQ